MKKIVVAGGCFWGVERFYQKIKGITDTQCFYINGTKESLNYKEVCSGKYGAIEAVALSYDEKIISLTEILDLLFLFIDPTSKYRQGNDVGEQYQVGLFYDDDNDKDLAIKFLANIQKNYEQKLTFLVEPVKSISVAEDYHQDYLIKNPFGYCHINFAIIPPQYLK